MGLYRKRDARVPTNACRSLGLLIRCHTMTEARQHNAAGSQPGAARLMACTDPVIFSFTGSWIWEWHRFNVNFLISVIKVQLICGFQVHALWPTLQGARRPYENHFASLQGWGHERCHHLSKLALGFNCVPPHWVLRLHPLPYVICSLQGYPRELVRSLGTAISLDDVLTVLDKHYNNVKALDTLNQELFQLQMGEEETVSVWGLSLLRHPQIVVALFLECFPPDHIAELNWDCFYRGLPKWFKVIAAYLKAKSNEKTFQLIFEWHEKQRRRKWWNHLVTSLLPVPTSPKWPASFFYRSSKAANQLLPLLHG